LGRVALALGVFDEALERLHSGLDGFERLERAQEAARTRLYRAEAWHGAGQADSARADLEQARERFAEMGADRDAARTEALMARFREAPRS
jgi:hypothetical protein